MFTFANEAPPKFKPNFIKPPSFYKVQFIKPYPFYKVRFIKQVFGDEEFESETVQISSILLNIRHLAIYYLIKKKYSPFFFKNKYFELRKKTTLLENANRLQSR